MAEHTRSLDNKDELGDCAVGSGVIMRLSGNTRPKIGISISLLEERIMCRG